MRVFEVRIKTDAEAKADFLAAIKLAQEGMPGPGDEGLFFTSYEAAYNLFTTKRLEMLAAIREHKPTSINQIAKITGRDFKNIYTDVMHFVKLDIIKIPRGKHAGESIEVLYDAFNLHAVI